MTEFLLPAARRNVSFVVYPHVESTGLTKLMQWVLLTGPNSPNYCPKRTEYIHTWITNTSSWKLKLNKRCSAGCTALFIALANIGDRTAEDTVKLLLQKGALYFADYEGNTFLSAALHREKFNFISSIISLIENDNLLEKADGHSLGNPGGTLLEKTENTLLEKTEDTLLRKPENALLEKEPALRSRKRRAMLNTANKKGNTPLHLAVLNSSITTLETILEWDMNINPVNSFLLTPLHMACIDNNFEKVRLLVQKGADVNAVSKSNKETPLKIACSNGNLDIVQSLLEKGAQVNVKNLNDLTELYEIVSYTLKKDTDVEVGINIIDLLVSKSARQISAYHLLDLLGDVLEKRGIKDERITRVLSSLSQHGIIYGLLNEIFSYAKSPSHYKIIEHIMFLIKETIPSYMKDKYFMIKGALSEEILNLSIKYSYLR